MVMVVDDSGMIINYWWLTNTIYYNIYMYIYIDLWRFPVNRGTPKSSKSWMTMTQYWNPCTLGSRIKNKTYLKMWNP